MTEHITHHSGEDYPVVHRDTEGFHLLPSASQYMLVIGGFRAFEVSRWAAQANEDGMDLPTWCVRQLHEGAEHRIRTERQDTP